MPPPTERQWQAQVVNLATMLGWLTYHTHDSRGSEPGFPDLVLVRDRVVFAELKTEKGRIRYEQTVWLERLRQAGSEVYLWRPSDLDKVTAVLRRRAQHGVH